MALAEAGGRLGWQRSGQAGSCEQREHDVMHLWLVADSHVERHAATGLAMGEGEALREKACDVGAGTVGGGGQIADTQHVSVGVVDMTCPRAGAAIVTVTVDPMVTMMGIL